MSERMTIPEAIAALRRMESSSRTEAIVEAVTAELDAVRAERDAIQSRDDAHQQIVRVALDRAESAEAALAALREAVREVLNEPHAYVGGRERALLTYALAALPADLAAQRDRRVRAEALEPAADAADCEDRTMGSGEDQTAAWLRARAADERGGLGQCERNQEVPDARSRVRARASRRDGPSMVGEPMKPWSDCPPCPSCALPCGTRDRQPSWLRCTACGHSWIETDPERIAQAERADEAWRAECARQDEIAAAQLAPRRRAMTQRVFERARR